MSADHSPKSLPLKLLLSLMIAGACAGVIIFALSAPTPLHTTDERPTISTNATGPMFQVANAEPGQPISRCMKVSYRGPKASVRLYTNPQVIAADRTTHLTITPGRQVSSSFPDCAGFVAAGPNVYQGTMASFASHNKYEQGLPTLPTGKQWGDNENVTYRFVITLPSTSHSLSTSTSTPTGISAAGRDFKFEARA